MNKPNQKEIKMHKTSYFMYEKTKAECIERMTEAMNPDGSKRWTQEEIDEKVKMIQMMQDDVKEKFLISGGNPNDLIIPVETPVKQKKLTVKKTTPKPTIANKKKIKKKKKENTEMPQIVEEKIENISPVSKNKQSSDISVVPTNWSNTDFSESFDVIPLPSKGECYENNMSTIAV